MASLEALIAAEIVKARLLGESFYYEMECQMLFLDTNGNRTMPCGQRFKFPRGCGGQVICPKCGMANDTSQPGVREAVKAIPVE